MTAITTNLLITMTGPGPRLLLRRICELLSLVLGHDYYYDRSLIALRTDDVKVMSELLSESIISKFLFVLAFPTKENGKNTLRFDVGCLSGFWCYK